MTTGREVLLEVLRSEGVRHIFGNPGTTELPLVDALADAGDLHYVLALQEATAVAMADGYAQATRRPAFLNLHTSAGLGNAIGNLTNAQANRTPLVVTAGQQDYRHIHTDPLLAGDLVGLATSVSKWAHEVRTLGELGTIMRRAFHDASSPPGGPVFVSLPMDILDQDGEVSVPPRSRIERGSVAPGLDELADLLVSTDRDKLAIVVGDEVAASSAVAEAVRVAEMLGVKVFGSPLHSNVVFPSKHPLWSGALAPLAVMVNAALANFERVLLVGGQAFMVYPYTPGPALPDSVELLHLSPDPYELGRVWPARLGLAGDPKASLAELARLLEARADTEAAGKLIEEARKAREQNDASYDQGARDRYDQAPMAPASAVHALVDALPGGTPVVDEAITTGTYLRGFLPVEEPGQYFFCRGGGLGWGMPAALGVSLGFDSSPVLCVVGDGSTMYSPQALWTAAHEGLPVVFAVVNNRQYLILKNALAGMGGAASRTGKFIGMDIENPPVDFIALAKSMGVDATLVEKAADVGDALRSALDAGKPHLLELPIATP